MNRSLRPGQRQAAPVTARSRSSCLTPAARRPVLARGTYPGKASEFALPGTHAPLTANGSIDLDNGGALEGQADSNSAPLAKEDFTKFVQFFRQAGPYIEGHRGRTFVLVVPGGVSAPTLGWLH
jgi:hypothetical protein